MKEKVIIFIAGLLVGAIVATGSILAYTLISGSNSSTTTTSGSGMQMPSGNPPSDMGGTPPDMTNSSTTESSN